MNSDNVARKVLEELGFKVNKIPTSDKEQKKEADFLVRYNSIVAIVEAKLKEDDTEVLAKRENALQAGNVSVVEASLGRNETYSRLIKNAKNQLIASSDNPHDFKIILFIVSGINPEAKRDQLKDTIYGSTLIFESSQIPTKICYFYRNSDFFRRTDIDAMIIGTSYDMYECNSLNTEICLNPYAENYLKLKQSDFLEPFGQYIIDPIELEKEGQAYIPDADVNRTLNEFENLCQMYNPILPHLQEKYKTGYIYPVDFNSPELAIRTDDNIT